MRITHTFSFKGVKIRKTIKISLICSTIAYNKTEGNMDTKKLTITNFEQYFSYYMLLKGRDYFENYIVSFFEESTNHYVANIKGSYLYITEVELGDDGEIISSDCSCPYDGNVCKHQIALFYKVHAHITEQRRAINHESYYDNLQNAYRDLSQKDLIDIIFDLSKNNFKLQNALLAKAHNKLDYNYVVQTINKYIELYGYDNNTEGGFDLVLTWLNDKRIQKGEELKVMLYTFKMLKILKAEHDADFLAHEDEYYDDDDYEEAQAFYGDYHLKKLSTLISEKVTNEAALILEDKKLLFYISGFITSANFDFSEDTSQTLLLSFNNLSTDEEIYRALLYVVVQDKNIAYHPRYSVHDFYYDFQYDLFLKRGHKEELESLVRENITYPPFCELLFTELMAKEEFLEAARIIETMIEANKERSWRNNSWYELLLKAYSAVNNTREIQRVAFILLNEGYYDYYALYKETFGDEWKSYFPKFLQTISDSGALYIEVLLKENLFADLMPLFQKEPYLIADYYKRFPSDYYPELSNYYKNLIIKGIEGRTGTKAYLSMKDDFIVIEALLGKEDYYTFIDELNDVFNNRPSLRKVLNEFRYHLR